MLGTCVIIPSVANISLFDSIICNVVIFRGIICSIVIIIKKIYNVYDWITRINYKKKQKNESNL